MDVKKINGYTIKDGNAIHKEDVIDNLESDESTKVLSAKQGKELKEYSNEKAMELDQSLKKYINNEWDLFQPYLNEELGTCVIIKKDDFVVMYDCGYTGQDNLIQAYLESKDIDHIDVLIISHFHQDHCGCQETILTNYCDETTRIFIGMVPDYTEFTGDETASQTKYQEFLALCNDLNLTYEIPTNNSKIEINDIIFRFLNTDTTNLEYYYAQKSDTNIENYMYSTLNNCCLVCEITLNNKKVLLTGDIEQPGQTKIKDYIDKVDLLMVPHHNWNSYGDKEFFDKANCELAFANRGTSEINYFPYFSRYSKKVKQTRIIQNLETPIEIKHTNNLLNVIKGVDMKTAFDDTTKTQILTFLPSVEHCKFDEVDLYDFSLWDSEYIFNLMSQKADREGFSTMFYTNSRYTALTEEIRRLDPGSNTEYSMSANMKYIDFTFGSYAYQTFRIYKGYTEVPEQKYAILLDNAFSNKTLQPNQINLSRTRNRPFVTANVRDGNTQNIYQITLTRLNTSIDNSKYIGYWQNLSSDRYLSFIKVELDITSAGYSLSYYRLVYDITNNTWTVNNTNPEIVSLVI